MSLICEPLRKFWLPGINEVQAVRPKGLAGWITLQKFQIYEQIGPETFNLKIQTGGDHDSFCGAIASDIARFGISAVESIEGQKIDLRLPKATAWLAIRSYYAAFYAAHAILRVFGETLTQFDTHQTQAIKEVAEIFGSNSGNLRIGNGLYHAVYNSQTGELECRKALKTIGGSHEAVWIALHARLRKIAGEILKTNSANPSIQRAATFLDELTKALSIVPGQSGATLLSSIRNRINYQHELGTWFPYDGQVVGAEDLLGLTNEWRKDPLALDLGSHRREELTRFFTACRAIVATYRALAEDMSSRCPVGVSFQKRGFGRLLEKI